MNKFVKFSINKRFPQPFKVSSIMGDFFSVLEYFFHKTVCNFGEDQNYNLRCYLPAIEPG